MSNDTKRETQNAGLASGQGHRRRRSPNTPPMGAARFADQSVKTIADAIHRRLRKSIVSLEYAPGLPISEQDLAVSEGVSRTPVREAILRLAKERLVEVIPKSGTFVARIPLSALPEAIVVRRALEGITVRAATQHATLENIAELHAIVERQATVNQAGDVEAFYVADEDFHAALAHVGRYPGVWDLIQQVKVHVDRYRRLTLPVEGRMQLVVEEHRGVLLAIEAGDADLAVARMEDHLGKLQLDISIFRDMWPDYFVHDADFEDELLKSLT